MMLVHSAQRPVPQRRPIRSVGPSGSGDGGRGGCGGGGGGGCGGDVVVFLLDVVW